MAAPTTPTTQQVSQNIISQISGQLGQLAPILPKAFTRVMAKALAGVVVTLYKFGGAMFLNMFVRFASNSPVTINGRTFVPLAEWADLAGADPQRAAVQAQLTISVTVVTQGGALTSGQQLVGPNGITYITTGDTLLNAATVSVTVTASGDQQGGDGAGAAGNLANGSVLTFVSPIAAVQPATTVTATTRTGVDQETTQAFRDRVRQAFRRKPRGGALADYPVWAGTSSAVLNAYPYTGATPGTVVVYIESSTEPDGIPTAGQLLEARTAIQQDPDGRQTRAPLGTLVNTQPITRETYNVTVTGLTVPNPADVQSDINSAMAEYFLQREPYLPGLNTGVRRNVITASGAGGVVSSIVDAAGGSFTTVTLELGGNNVESRILPEGAKAKVGTVSYA